MQRCGRWGRGMNDRISFEDYLSRYGSLTYSNRGTSMEPLLRQGRDLLTVKKKGPERCRAGDVVLFRHRGKYILHRVVEVREEDYVCLGDNAVSEECGVTDGDILGVLTGFVRKGKEYRTDDPRYRIYSALILRTNGVRVFCRRAAGKIKRLLLG